MPKSKLEKQKEAEERNKARSKRSHSEQIAHLDAIFGKDQGANRERARLAALLKVSSAVTSVEKPKKKKKKSEESATN